MRKINISQFRLFLWLVLIIVTGWLLYMGVVPGGRISYVYDFTKPSYFIKKLTPEERVKPIVVSREIGASQVIIGDPVYFTLRTPRKFSKAKLTLKYKNISDLPLIEAGVLADKIVWRYDLQPIKNKIINQLTLSWQVISENGVMLLQRERNYNSLDEFLNNLPEAKEIALYNYDLKKEFLLPDYEAGESGSLASSQVSLRGPYEFYTYIKAEDLDFTFSFLDLNNNKDCDPIDLRLYYNDQLIDSRHLDDDGIATDNNEATERGEIKLRLANLPEGAYKIEARVNDDIITKSIISEQQKLAFVNKIWLAQGSGSKLSLYTDSREINAQTINPASLQTIKITDAKKNKAETNLLKLGQTYKLHSIKVEPFLSQIKIDKDDVILSGDGVFSFSEDSLINPNFKKVKASLDIDQEGINYILARYTLPGRADGWEIAQAEFNLGKAYQEFYSNKLVGATQYSFLISIPGLKADDGIDEGIEIGEIRVDLEGKSLWKKITGKRSY